MAELLVILTFALSTGLKNLKVLSLGFNNITDACLVHIKGLSLSLSNDRAHTHNYSVYYIKFLLLFKHLYSLSLVSGLTKLESLNLDSCKIGDEGLANLKGSILVLPSFTWITVL